VTAPGVAERLTSLVGALRAHGMRIGTGETVDAAQAVAELGLTDRELLREGLAATLLHGPAQRQVFDPVFDLYFPRGIGAPETGPADRDDLRDRLAAALAADEEAGLEDAGRDQDRFGPPEQLFGIAEFLVALQVLQRAERVVDGVLRAACGLGGKSLQARRRKKAEGAEGKQGSPSDHVRYSFRGPTGFSHMGGAWSRNGRRAPQPPVWIRSCPASAFSLRRGGRLEPVRNSVPHWARRRPPVRQQALRSPSPNRKRARKKRWGRRCMSRRLAPGSSK